MPGTAEDAAIVDSELAIFEPQLSLVGHETRGEARHDLPGLGHVADITRWSA
jgi:hypothetical protein